MSEKFVLKRFGDLVPGDLVEGLNGELTEVVEAYDEHIPETMYEIETDNGSIIKASGNHLWYIESSLDIDLHSERRRLGRKFFGNLSKETFNKLLSIAEYPGDEKVETSLMDIIALLDVEHNPGAISSLVRVAESIGPIAENNVIVRDLAEDTGGDTINSVKNYDAKRFAQQVLSLSGVRKYRKRWNLVVGRVVTTELMLQISKNFDVHIPDPETTDIKV